MAASTLSVAFSERCRADRRRSRRWARLGIATITRSPKAFSPPWNPSCWHGSTFPSLAAARLAVFDFVEGFYNTHRRHSALGYQSPAAYERRAQACAAA